MPRRKSKEPALAELEAAPLEAKRKRPRKSDEPTAVAEPLRQIVEAIPGLTTGDHLLTQLPPAEPEKAELEPYQQRISEILGSRAIPLSKAGGIGALGFRQNEPLRQDEPEGTHATPEANGKSHVDRVAEDKPTFRAVPDGFRNVDSYPVAGVKVNKSLDRNVVSIQFAEDRLPTRAEKDLLEAITEPGSSFVYKTERRQWERFNHEQPGANLMDAKELAGEIARGRAERGR